MTRMNDLLRRGSLFAGSLALSLAAASLCGCGSGSGKGATVSGKVTYLGKEVTGGTIKFHPSGGGAPLQAAINRDGTYSFVNAPVGQVKVTVETESIKPPANLPPEAKAYAEKNPKSPVYVPVPLTYADVAKTSLSYDVVKGENKKDFDLQ